MEDLCKEDSIDSNPDGDSGNTQIKLPEGKKYFEQFSMNICSNVLKLILTVG